jgi:GTP-binding protein
LIFFALDETRRLVDLPGYGYAKVCGSVKQQWQRHMASYLERRSSLAGLVLVMDIRHSLTAFDLQMLEWGRRTDLAMLLLLTKSDKLKRGASHAELHRVRKLVAGEEARVRVELFSSLARRGIEPVHAILDHWLGVAEGAP